MLALGRCRFSWLAMNGWGEGEPQAMVAEPPGRIEVGDGPRAVSGGTARVAEGRSTREAPVAVDENLDVDAALRSSETAVVVLETGDARADDRARVRRGPGHPHHRAGRRADYRISGHGHGVGLAQYGAMEN